LLDARILADVYLAMTGGQNALALGDAAKPAVAVVAGAAGNATPPASLRVVAASSEEQVAHEEFMKLVQKVSGGKALWQ
jgi:DNA polymerase III subunit epsilon